MLPATMIRRSAAFALLAGAAMLAPARAMADEVERCATASENGQARRLEGKLRIARSEFLACARASCPAAMRVDCDREMAAIDAILPSVVLRARDALGRDLGDVRVLLDGVLLTERLDGKSIAVDPGRHVFRWEVAGAQPFEQRVVIVEAQKNRLLAVVFPSADQKTEASTSDERSLPTSSILLGGIGVVALSAFAVLALTGQSTFDRCERTRTCSEDERDALSTRRVLAFTALGVGAASIGVAAALYIWRPAPPVEVRGRGAGAELLVRF